MALNESWNLKSRARECSATAQPFADGESIFTALFQAEDGSFERLDFSSEGWQQRLAGDQPQPFSHWRSRFRIPQAVGKPQVVEKESAEDLLKRLVEDDDEGTENVRYILTVMLERQRLLRETDRQRTPTGILRVYEHRKTGEVLIIRDPDIPLDQVDQIQAEVMAMLEPDKVPAEPESGEQPATEEPATEEPATEEPATEEPATEEPADTADSEPEATQAAEEEAPPQEPPA